MGNLVRTVLIELSILKDTPKGKRQWVTTRARRQAFAHLKALKIPLKADTTTNREIIANLMDCKIVPHMSFSKKTAGNILRWWYRNLNKNELLKTGKKKNTKKLLSQGFYESREWRALRYKALVKYGAQCQCCGASPPQVVLHVDHVKPRSLHPHLELKLSNLQILCEACNLGKSNKDDTDFRDKEEVPDELDQMPPW